MQEVHINGPVNIVRLEGNVGGVNKVIHLFMDFHMQVNQQTECDNVRNIDVDKFLVKLFDENKGKIYDLFVENNPLYPYRFPDLTKLKGRYLFEQTAKLMNKAMRFDKDKVVQSGEFDNVRFHYADIREYTTRKTDKVFNEIRNLVSLCERNYRVTYGDIVVVVDGLKLIVANMIWLYNTIYKEVPKEYRKSKVIFTNNQEILASYSEEDYRGIGENIVFKIMDVYDNVGVKEVMNKIMHEDVHENFQSFFEKMNDMIDYLNKLEKTFEPYKGKNIFTVLFLRTTGIYNYGLDLSKLFDLYDMLYEELVGGVSAKMMDVYTLRRMLDKKYMTNIIAYTGAAHSVNYVRYLVKYFGFRVVGAAYVDRDIGQAMDIIKKSKSSDELHKLFFTPIFKQCSIAKNLF